MARRPYTRKLYFSLVAAYRLDPGNHSQAARVAHVEWRTAKRAWEAGWKGLSWASPIKELFDASSPVTRAGKLLSRDEVAMLPRGSVVYFIQAVSGGPVKIGTTTSLVDRLRAIQSGCPERLIVLGTIAGGEKEERRLHAQLAHHRLHGEWFAEGPARVALSNLLTPRAA